MARCSVETIALRQLMEDRSSNILLEVFRLTKRYLILIVLQRSTFPNVVYKPMYPRVSTRSPGKPTI